jgi:hypothetical protein
MTYLIAVPRHQRIRKRNWSTTITFQLLSLREHSPELPTVHYFAISYLYDNGGENTVDSRTAK